MKNNDTLLLLLGLLILSLKLFIIDIDPPKWKVSLYQPLDELYYVNNAYNYFETGSLFGEDEPEFNSAILTNVVTYIALEVFGDNYFGLRLSSWFFSVVSFLFLFFLLNRVTENKKLKLIAVLFFTLNFSFTTANLVVEPTIARMMAAILSLWLVVKWAEKNHPKSPNLIWQAAVITSLFIFVYPTNAFLGLAGYASLVVFRNPIAYRTSSKIRFKEILIETGYFVSGVLLAFFLYYTFIRFFGGNIIESWQYRASSYDGRTAFGLRDFGVNLLKLVLANYFRFNPLWLFLVMVSFVGIFFRRKQQNNHTILITLLFLLSFVMQSAFVNDYPWRKLIILLPFFILIGTYGIETFWREIPKVKKKWLFLIIVASSFPLLLLLYWENDFYGSALFLFPLVTTIFGLLIFTAAIFSKKIRRFSQYLLFFLLILPELVYSVEHYLVKRPNYYKETYQALSEYNGHFFIGGSSKGFRSYNNIKPLLSMYNYYGRENRFWKKTDSLSRNGLKDYSIGYDYYKEEYEKIGYKPLKVILPAEKTVSTKDIVLYEEVELK